jgi:hypothetical protein
VKPEEVLAQIDKQDHLDFFLKLMNTIIGIEKGLSEAKDTLENQFLQEGKNINIEDVFTLIEKQTERAIKTMSVTALAQHLHLTEEEVQKILDQEFQYIYKSQAPSKLKVTGVVGEGTI